MDEIFVKLLLFLIISICVHKTEAVTDEFSTLDHIKPKATSETQAEAVQNLINRIIPNKAFLFSITVDSNLNDNDIFRIEKTENGIIHITGTTGVAAASGFNYYLKYFCNCHVSWEASQLNLPEELPDVNITITLNDRFRYYQNVCTTSYSFVWWNWEQWEKHIDWMALNSFNLVLAFNGQEAIWERVYRKFNLTTQDINEHFTGPAFLSWLRMGNMRGWGGPLSNAWHSRSIILQKKILDRMRSLGITPVLPAFAGHLPRAFKRLYPDANMVKMGPWMSFEDPYCCPYFLDPTEELFNLIGKAFITEQISEFGTDHVYNCDSFNEMTPSSGDLTYLNNVGKAIYKAMIDVDPKAIWLMQNWMFVNGINFWTLERAKAMLTAVPIGKMIILDLQSEQFPQYNRLKQYFGQPYIWCMLHNFGGTLGMFGSLSTLNEAPIEARNGENSTMIGTGLTPEGINQNYVVYEFMTETAWRNNPTNLTEWIENYVTRRYGFSDENVKKAWLILLKTIYNFTDRTHRIMGQYAIANSPRFGISTWKWYSADDLFEAWTYLIRASDNLEKSSAYIHDLVDVTRQWLQVIGDNYYNMIAIAYKTDDYHSFEYSSKVFLDIFSDLEAILATNKAFLLGPWIDSAKKAANSTQEAQQFEHNARNQITLWGPGGEIMDYANKQWSGIASNFFAPRWQLFINYANETLLSGKTFDQSYISSKIFTEVEKPFTFDQGEFPIEPAGDTVDVAKRIYQKWNSTFRLGNKCLTSEKSDEENCLLNTLFSLPLIRTIFSKK